MLRFLVILAILSSCTSKKKIDLNESYDVFVKHKEESNNFLIDSKIRGEYYAESEHTNNHKFINKGNLHVNKNKLEKKYVNYHNTSSLNPFYIEPVIGNKKIFILNNQGILTAINKNNIKKILWQKNYSKYFTNK